MQPDLSNRIGDIARRLLGEPNGEMSKHSQLRFGSNGSVSVEITGPKRGQWYDHELGTGGGPWDFLRVKGGMGDGQAVNWLRSELGIEVEQKPRSRIVAIYDYVDEQGALQFQVLRWGPKKTFSQQQPGSGKGGIKRGPDGKPTMQGARYVPYHLDELTAAKATGNGHPWRVYICEGEKDADRLRDQWGLVATTNPGGARKWRSEYNRYFAGADVLVIPDNDRVGRKHAQNIAANLFPVAARVRIVELQGLPDKGDVSDWIEYGGTQSDLETTVELAPTFWPNEQTTKPNGHDNEGVSLDDFYAYMPMHNYIFAPTREMWPAASVNARISPILVGEEEITASLWIDQNRPVEQMTWVPGLPMIIENRLIEEGGWIERKNVSCFNLYRPPTIKPGDATQAGPWLDHARKVYPDDFDHIVKWLAQRVQQPQDKINHALVLGGKPGIGKDTLLEPPKRAVGPWNFREVLPEQVCGRFNGFLKSTILRVNEARDLGEFDRFQFHERMKAYTAAPPDVLRCDEKNLREYSVFNRCGVIITTNHKTNGIYLPADDRRHYVAWSDLPENPFPDAYWRELWSWYDHDGAGHVAAYLAGLDLSGFNPKAPPPKTPAFWEIVDANRAPEDAELADVLERLGMPETVTIQQLIRNAPEPFNEWLGDRKNARLIPHRLEECGYVAVRCSSTKDGRWKVGGKNQVVYAQASLSIRDRYAAAAALSGRGW
jgi:hypothetical protein